MNEKTMTGNYDIAIIGGGPVGAALALALRGSKLKVCVLEARPANAASSDARALALSYGSRLLLARLGIWDALHDISPIRTIHISQKQSFGRAVLHAAELNVPELGYVLPYPALQDALTDALRSSDVASIYGASVTQLTSEADHAAISYQQDGAEHTLHARLAVVADGGKLLAQQFPPEVHDYGQSALITHITCSAPQHSSPQGGRRGYPEPPVPPSRRLPSNASPRKGRWRCCHSRMATNWSGLRRIKPRRTCWLGTTRNF